MYSRIFTDFVVWLLEKELAMGLQGKIISLILFISGAALFTMSSIPFGFLLVIRYPFFYSGFPSEWTRTEPINAELS